MAHWLVKTEPSTYSIEDLKRDRTTLWDKVRNYQARNFLKEMKRGDSVLVYHSSAEAQTGIVGLATVEREAVADPSQFDRKSEYFDPKATIDAPRWWSPKLKFVRTTRCIPLEELRALKQLSSFQLLKRGNRLSVLPVQPTEFDSIKKLVDKEP